MAACVLVAVLAGCDTDGAGAARAREAPPGEAAVAAGERVGARADTIRAPVIVYVQASGAEVEAERAKVSADDFEVIADDLSFYRGSAYLYLEQQHVPVLRLEGRRPLVFRSGDVSYRRDFAELSLLDFIVVYHPGSEPRTFAPNEVDAAVAAFREEPQ